MKSCNNVNQQGSRPANQSPADNLHVAGNRKANIIDAHHLPGIVDQGYLPGSDDLIPDAPAKSDGGNS